MTIPSLAGVAPTEFPDLLLLLPIRPPVLKRPLSPCCLNQMETRISKSDAEPAAACSSETQVSAAGRPQKPEWDRSWRVASAPHTAAQRYWECLLQHATVSLLEKRVSEAVRWVQRAHAWKNQWEKSATKFLVLKPSHWLILAACSTAAGDDDTAAVFAVQAWHAAGSVWSDDFVHDFRHSRADAATLLALSRMRQHCPGSAVALLEWGINGHRGIGDLEQLAADYLLLSLCFESRADIARAVEARRSAAVVLTESLDPTRHHRGPHLAAWLQQKSPAIS